MRSSGKCDNLLTEDECVDDKSHISDTLRELGNGTWFGGGTYNDTWLPAGCSYTGSGYVRFNRAEGDQAADCSPSQICLCKKQGKIIAAVCGRVTRSSYVRYLP